MITNYVGDVIIAWENCPKDAILVHGCNCFHTMGAGIARRIKELYREAYDADTYTVYGDKSKLGTYSKWNFPDLDYFVDKTIVNAYTQYNYGIIDNKIPFSYKAFEKVMTKINEDFPTQEIFMPRIGCGLAGADWDKVKEILEKVFKNRIIRVYTLN